MKLQAVGVLIAAMALATHADQRPFVWTYGSDLMKRGQVELETYTTFRSPDWTKRDTNLKTIHQFELEIGMNERFDFALYQVISQEANQSATWDGMKLRGRFLLSDSKTLWSPVLYAEAKLDATLGEPEYELKLLLENAWSNYTFALNPIIEIEENETEFEVAAGLSYAFGPLWSLGVEAMNSEYGTWLGPTISHGKNGLYTSLGSSWSLGDPVSGKPSHLIRLIVGIELRKETFKY